MEIGWKAFTSEPNLMVHQEKTKRKLGIYPKKNRKLQKFFCQQVSWIAGVVGATFSMASAEVRDLINERATSNIISTSFVYCRIKDNRRFYTCKETQVWKLASAEVSKYKLTSSMAPALILDCIIHHFLKCVPVEDKHKDQSTLTHWIYRIIGTGCILCEYEINDSRTKQNSVEVEEE